MAQAIFPLGCPQGTPQQRCPARSQHPFPGVTPRTFEKLPVSHPFGEKTTPLLFWSRFIAVNFFFFVIKFSLKKPGKAGIRDACEQHQQPLVGKASAAAASPPTSGPGQGVSLLTPTGIKHLGKEAQHHQALSSPSLKI